MDFSAVILAGGGSTRMGCDKKWLEYRGRPLIQRQVETLRACSAREVFISANQPGGFGQFGCPVVADNFTGCGPLGGIESALAVAGSELLLVLAVDMPLITPRTLRKLVLRCECGCGVLPVSEFHPQPLAAVYPRQSHHAILQFLGDGVRSATAFAEICVELGLMHQWAIPPSLNLEFANWNTPEDVTCSQPRASRRGHSPTRNV